MIEIQICQDACSYVDCLFPQCFHPHLHPDAIDRKTERDHGIEEEREREIDRECERERVRERVRERERERERERWRE